MAGSHAELVRVSGDEEASGSCGMEAGILVALRLAERVLRDSHRVVGARGCESGEHGPSGDFSNAQSAVIELKNAAARSWLPCAELIIHATHMLHSSKLAQTTTHGLSKPV